MNSLISSLFLATGITGVNEVLEAGKQVGTSGNQALLGGLIVILTLVLLYRERQQTLRARQDQQHHEDLILQINKERDTMTTERNLRADTLIKIITENTVAFIHLKTFLEHAVRILPREP